jgi:hypothetical protein
MEVWLFTGGSGFPRFLPRVVIEKSMKYRADIPNFVVSWYGIGTIASAFGIDYICYEGTGSGYQAVL